MAPLPVNRMGAMRGVAGCFILLLASVLLAGCATTSRPRPEESRRTLRPIPRVPAGDSRPDRALVGAFFAANGIRLAPAQAEEIVPPSARAGRFDRAAFRRAARQHNRLLLPIQADPATLWTELGRNTPLLVLLPANSSRHPDVRPGMPVAWDRGAGTIELLDGTGNIQTMAEDVFFSRGESLEHTALCLLRPGQLPRRQPTREQQLLLADFWFDRGFYRRAAAAYEALHDQALRDRVNIDSLVGSGNVLVRQGRPQQAIPLFDSALTLDPGNPRFLNNLAYAMHQGHGNLAAALSHAEKATERAPGNPIYLETLGSLYLDLGDAPAAAHCFEQAWARTAGHAPEVQLPILDQLVRAWLAANRRDLAWQVAEHRRRSFPGHPFPKDIQLAFPALRNPLPNRR